MFLRLLEGVRSKHVAAELRDIGASYGVSGHRIRARVHGVMRILADPQRLGGAGESLAIICSKRPFADLELHADLWYDALVLYKKELSLAHVGGHFWHVYGYDPPAPGDEEDTETDLSVAPGDGYELGYDPLLYSEEDAADEAPVPVKRKIEQEHQHRKAMMR